MVNQRDAVSPCDHASSFDFNFTHARARHDSAPRRGLLRARVPRFTWALGDVVNQGRGKGRRDP